MSNNTTTTPGYNIPTSIQLNHYQSVWDWMDSVLIMTCVVVVSMLILFFWLVHISMKRKYSYCGPDQLVEQGVSDSSDALSLGDLETFTFSTISSPALARIHLQDKAKSDHKISNKSTTNGELKLKKGIYMSI